MTYLANRTKDHQNAAEADVNADVRCTIVAGSSPTHQDTR